MLDQFVQRGQGLFEEVIGRTEDVEGVLGQTGQPLSAVSGESDEITDDVETERTRQIGNAVRTARSHRSAHQLGSALLDDRDVRRDRTGDN